MKNLLGLVAGAVLLAGMALAQNLDDANKAYNGGDYAKALELYKKLCDDKEAKACSSLGYMYRNGKGVSENATLAQQFYKKACDAGDKESCSNVNW